MSEESLLHEVLQRLGGQLQVGFRAIGAVTVRHDIFLLIIIGQGMGMANQLELNNFYACCRGVYFAVGIFIIHPLPIITLLIYSIYSIKCREKQSLTKIF